MIYHITMAQGRSDTFYLHATTKQKVLNFLNTVSTAIVRNIKEVVYSKNYNINFSNDTPFIPSATYHKVIIFAYSKKYSQQFILYNVKKTITEDFLKEQYKTLLILDEPIIGFFNISFYDEVSRSENIDNLYQVQYKRNSKTYTEDFYANSYNDVKQFFINVVDGELMEIRKYVHLDTTIKKDDLDYRKRMSIYVSDSKYYFTASIPKIKREFKTEELKTIIQSSLKYYNKDIDFNSIQLTFR